MSIVKLAGATALVTVMASSAWAASVSLQYNGDSAVGGGYDKVDVTNTNPDAARPFFNNQVAGGFDMTDTSGLLGDFVAWCLDMGAYLGTSGTHSYETTDTPFSNSYGLGADGMARVQAVFDASYGDDVLANKTNSAGFQLALWEVVYDDGFDLTTGDLMALNADASDDSAVISAAEGYLGAAFAYAGGKKWNLTYLESPGNKQNLVTVSPVPLPASALMLIGAVGGLAAMRRRRKKA